jgi:hypothetical protein
MDKTPMIVGRKLAPEARVINPAQCAQNAKPNTVPAFSGMTSTNAPLWRQKASDGKMPPMTTPMDGTL